MAGALVGLGAGVKLTPAATGLYFTARRQWLAVIWSAVAFAGTIGLTYLLHRGRPTGTSGNWSVTRVASGPLVR